MTGLDLRALVDQVPGVILYQIAYTGEARRCTYISAGVEQVFGVPPAAVMADPRALDTLIVPEDLGRLFDVAGSARRTKEPYDIEIRARTVTGEDRWLHCRAIPRPSKDAEVVTDGVMIDITTRKRVEEQLANLADSLPEVTLYQVVRRPDGSNYFPYMSAGQLARYGLTPERVRDDPSAIYALIVDEDVVKLRAAADASIETLRPFDVECRLKSVHGEERRVQVRGRPRRLPDGSTLWDAIALDVSDRKRAETAEREAAMLRAVAALAAAAAHEINNPLAVIMGRISLAREDGQLGEHAGAVLEAVQRMHEIVTRLGQITKLELLGDVPSDLPPMLDIRRSGERRGP